MEHSRGVVRAKRHHYVPQLYLRYFLRVGEKTFWVYDKKGGEPRPQNPINTAVESGFYAINSAEDDELEQLLQRVEDLAKPIFDRWQVDKAVPEPKEMSVIAEFLALQLTRVPRAVSVGKEIGVSLVKSCLYDMVEEPDNLRKAWKEFTESQIEPIDFTFEQAIESLKQVDIHVHNKFALLMVLSAADKIGAMLLNMNWTLCTAPDTIFFLTSDAPVTIYSQHGRFALFGGGLLLKNVELTFPISPHVCVLLNYDGQGGRKRINDKLVREFNRRTVCAAERFIISPIKAKFVARLIQEFSWTYQAPKMNQEQLIQMDRLQRLKERTPTAQNNTKSHSSTTEKSSSYHTVPLPNRSKELKGVMPQPRLQS